MWEAVFGSCVEHVHQGLKPKADLSKDSDVHACPGTLVMCSCHDLTPHKTLPKRDQPHTPLMLEAVVSQQGLGFRAVGLRKPKIMKPSRRGHGPPHGRSKRSASLSRAPKTAMRYSIRCWILCSHDDRPCDKFWLPHQTWIGKLKTKHGVEIKVTPLRWSDTALQVSWDTSYPSFERHPAKTCSSEPHNTRAVERNP